MTDDKPVEGTAAMIPVQLIDGIIAGLNRFFKENDGFKCTGCGEPCPTEIRGLEYAQYPDGKHWVVNNYGHVGPGWSMRRPQGAPKAELRCPTCTDKDAGVTE